MPPKKLDVKISMSEFSVLDFKAIALSIQPSNVALSVIGVIEKMKISDTNKIPNEDFIQ